MDTITPYAGTSGWSGSDASRERAERRDSTGLTGALQADIYNRAGERGVLGITIAELREMRPDQHHGNLSGALTALHKAGYLHRLLGKRGQCSVYVTEWAIDGRETVPPKRPVEKVEEPNITFRATDGVNHIGWKIITAARDNGGTIKVTIL